jgi:hypothetical protein
MAKWRSWGEAFVAISVHYPNLVGGTDETFKEQSLITTPCNLGIDL